MDLFLLGSFVDRKTFTFMIVSNRKGDTKSFVISAAWLKTMAALLAVFVVLAAGIMVDYFGLLVQVGENKYLRAENLQLKRQFQVIEGKVNALETGLERIKSFSTKLRLITDVEDQDRKLKLAIGPMPKVGQAYEMEPDALSQREPASVALKADSLFIQKPPLDFSKGELSVEGQRDYASLSIRIDKAVRESQLREQGIIELWETLAEREHLLNATPSIRPVRGWFTSKFGYRISPFTGKPVMHNGLDIAAPPGATVYSPADGIVTFVGFDPGYGKTLSIDHGYGLVTRYAHNSSILVQVGQKIKRRDPIASVGDTGRSTGPHLHYEVRINDIPVDPVNYILDE